MSESSVVVDRGRASKWRLVAVMLVGLLLAALAAPLLPIAIGRLDRLLFYPYPTDGLEAPLLLQARLLWSGQQLYQPFELYRFISSPYPPWHPLILGFADRFAGPHLFWSGRMVSLIAALLTLPVLILCVRLAARSWLAGIFAAVILVSAPPFVLWATRIKPDMYALLWTALGVMFALSATNDERRTTNDEQRDSMNRLSLVIGHWSLVGASICFALAFFTKQTALAAPLAVGLALVSDDWRRWQTGERSRNWLITRRTLMFGLSYLLLIGMTWALLDLWSQGQFTFHIWTQHRNAVWTPQLMWKFVSLLADSWPLVLLGVGVLVLAWRDRAANIPAWYLLVAPFTLFGAGKTGANHNHLLEMLLALAMAGGVALGWGLRNISAKPLIAAGVCVLIALQLVLAYTPLPWYGSELDRNGPTPERFIAFIRNQPGEVLADDPGLLYLAGKPLRYDDPSGFGPVAHSGLWDQRGLIDDIANRRFSAILVPFDTEVDTIDPSGRWTPEMIAAVRDHYQLLFRDTIITYVPK